MSLLKKIIVLFALLASPATAQWQVPVNTIPVGRGAGVTGFNSVANTGTGNLCLLNTAPPSFGSCSGASACTTLGAFLVGTGSSSQCSTVAGSSAVVNGSANFSVPNAVFYNPAGTNPVLFQMAHGSDASRVAAITPTVAISRNEATTADTQGGQNAALLINLKSNNNISAGPVVPQGNALTVNSSQSGTGGTVAGYFTATSSGGISGVGGLHGGSFGLFAAAQSTGAGNSALAFNGIVSNNSGSDCAYASVVPGGTTCAEIGIFLQASGANLHSAGMLLYSNSGQFDCGYCVYPGAVSNNAFLSTGFTVDAIGNETARNVTFNTTTSFLSWATAAANAGINFNPGTIQRRSSDGHIQYNAQGGNHEFLNTTAASAASVSVGQSGGGGGSLILYGGTSGAATISPQAVEGTTALTLPNTSGTLADGASTPLVLNATTGNLTCPTCATSAASLTANQLVIGSGSQGTQSLGSLGATTTLLHGNAAGAPSFGSVVSADMNITTTSCTNQFVTAISAGGVGTCTTDTLASAQHANQGTTTTVLHGNGAGNPSFGAVSLTADISGVLPYANGGSNANTAWAQGSVLFAGASAFAQDNTNFFWDGTNHRLGIGTASPSNQLSFSGQSAQTINLEREVTAATVGQNLTVLAGGAVSGGTDLTGGNVILSAGIGTGTAGGVTGNSNGAIVVLAPNLGSTTGTTDRTPTEIMRVYNSSNFGTICFGGSMANCDGFKYNFQGSSAFTLFNVPNAGGQLLFQTGGTNRASLQSGSLNISATPLVLSFGTPTIGSGACGATTNGTVAGSNQTGLVTIGAAATTTCTVSFSATLSQAPIACVITPANATAAATGTTVARVSSISTSAWVITGSVLASANYYYHCI